MGIEQTKWILLFELSYLVGIIAVCLIIIFDTRSISKTLAYLLFTIFVPFIGVIFYFSFGINYRKRKIYSKKLAVDDILFQKTKELLEKSQQKLFQSGNESVDQNKELIRLLANKKTGSSPVFPKNKVILLNNGEEFFPLLIKELEKAKHHIHIEYYIYENDAIGNQIKDILIRKATEGIKVRFIYDDFGSKGIRKNIAEELRNSGVEAYPFNKIKLIYFANRLNYRNHRKIVIIDGITSFTGGINVSDRYINPNPNKLYWRDTNLMIKGIATYRMQQIFLSDWNFCSKQDININRALFPEIELYENAHAAVQIASNGPDSEIPNILYSILQSISLAKEEVLLTTPYYIPETSLQEAIIIAGLSGLDVKLLLPKVGDSKLVNIATQSYFEDLLAAGVKIFLYEKGFIHAKTFVTDRKLASVGTANLDLRSFDLNFEVNALVYDEDFATELAESFDEDLKHSEQLLYEDWKKRGKIKKFIERLVRLISPFL